MSANAAMAAAGFNVPTQRTRSAAQGLTLGFADELEARAVSLASGRPYEEVLDEVREKLAAYREAYPMSSLAYEAGGAMAPTAISLLLSPFTGGASTATTLPTWARVLGIGAAEGAAYGFGTGEGGLGERIDSAGKGAVTGGIGGVVGGKVADFGFGALKNLADASRRVVGRRGPSVVENEIQRLVAQTGKTADEVVQDLMDGRILAENRTLAAAIKAMQTGPATDVIQDFAKTRPAMQRAKSADELGQALNSRDPQFPAVQKYLDDEDQLQKAISREYKPFRNKRLDQATFDELKKILERNPQFGTALNELQSVKMRKPLYTVGDDGIKFLRRPTVQEAEEVYKVIRDRGVALSADKKGTVAGATKDLAKRLKSKLDTAFPKLADARKMAQAKITNAEAYKAGEDALSKGDFYRTMMDLDKTYNTPEALDAFKMGFLGAIQTGLTKGRQKSLVRKLGDDTLQEGMLLRQLLPDDEEYNKVLKQLQLATESEDVANKILNATITGETLISKAAQNSNITASDFLGILAGSPDSYFRAVGKFANKFSRDLTDEENLKIAQILVSEDPDLVRNAIIDESGAQKLVDWFANNRYRVARGATLGGATFATGGADEIMSGMRGEDRKGMGLLESLGVY